MENVKSSANLAWIVPTLGLGIDLVGAFEFLGAKIMIESLAPVLAAFTPYLGVFFITMPFLWIYYKIKNSTINSFEEIQTCGEELITYHLKTQKRIKKKLKNEHENDINEPPHEPPSSKSGQRHIILRDKYDKWFKPRPEKYDLNKNVMQAARCAEIIRAHGYIVGRYMIWNNIRKWKKEVKKKQK